METLKSLSRRVAVAQDIRGIVRTMKSLAAVSIRQYEQAVESLSEYNKTLRLGFRILFHSSLDGHGSDLMDSEVSNSGNRPRRFGAIVFGSDLGLCGQFNEEIADYAVREMNRIACGRLPSAERSSDPPGGRVSAGATDAWALMPIGNRIQVQLAERGYVLDHREGCPSSLAGITPFVQGLLPEVQRWQEQNQFDQVVIFHNKRTSSSTFRPHSLKLLPPDFRDLTQPRPSDGEFATLPTFTMDRVELFRSLVRQYLFVTLFRACAESLASENASRIASMQSAEKTIDDRLEELRSRLNERRQTAITEELLDIITGYEASQK